MATKRRDASPVTNGKSKSRSLELLEVEDNHPPIIALAGSAGLFAALQDFFRTIPADSGLAFVVVTHLDPMHPSTLPTVIRHWTKMRVVQAYSRQKIDPNTVYVIPSGKFLRCTESGFRLLPFRAHRGVRRAIDIFFSSLAEVGG